MKKYDFSGWATRNNIRCSDGRTIMDNAFLDNDGQTVPLVWNHQHNESSNVLGHALLENRAEGVYAYCTFNDTESGRNAKQLVEHGDVTALSIYANQLKQQGGNVNHGQIREVSLVLAGANPGAFIDSIIKHGEAMDDEAIIYTGENLLLHAECQNGDKSAKKEVKPENNKKEEKDMSDDRTVKDVFDTLTEEQKNVVYALIGACVSEQEGGTAEHSALLEGGDVMKHNIFDGEQQANETLSHAEMETILKDAKRYGSLKESFLQHSGEYGIEDIDWLFPDHRTLQAEPDFISRDMGWVAKVMGGVRHTPFSRIKSIHADITADEARALGYMKGGLKKEEVFTLLKRTTEPQTVYKKQKLDRDDIIDITDFDVVAFIKKEMRIMLDEEIARAILVGDGRLPDDDYKIKEDKIRPVVSDADLYNIKVNLVDEEDVAPAKSMIKQIIRARKNYKGSGEPTFYTTEDVLTDMLLLEDGMGRPLYDTVSKLATALRVKDIVTVPVMEGHQTTESGITYEIFGCIVNLRDYSVGADKGGAIGMFDDFDIDYNQQKYLMETRCSGALTKPFSAMTIRKAQAQAQAQA